MLISLPPVSPPGRPACTDHPQLSHWAQFSCDYISRWKSPAPFGEAAEHVVPAGDGVHLKLCVEGLFCAREPCLASVIRAVVVSGRGGRGHYEDVQRLQHRLSGM